jgi:hypothetical protein
VWPDVVKIESMITAEAPRAGRREWIGLAVLAAGTGILAAFLLRRVRTSSESGRDPELDPEQAAVR